MTRSTLRRALPGLVLVLVALAGAIQLQSGNKEKFASFRGRVYRSDTNQPVANALLVLLDEKKSDTSDNTVQTRTDDQGNFVFEKLAEGKYTISIRAWYKNQDDAPCQLLMARTKDKDSSVVVARDKEQFVQQVFIKGFSIKAGKEITRDFDFTCQSMFGK